MPLSDKAKCKKVEKIFNEANVIDVNIRPTAHGAEVEIYIKINSEQVVMGFHTSDIVDNPRQLQKVYRYKKPKTRVPKADMMVFDEFYTPDFVIDPPYPF